MEQTEQLAILERFIARQLQSYLLELSKQEKQPRTGPELVLDFMEYISSNGDYVKECNEKSI